MLALQINEWDSYVNVSTTAQLMGIKGNKMVQGKITLITICVKQYGTVVALLKSKVSHIVLFTMPASRWAPHITEPIWQLFVLAVPRPRFVLSRVRHQRHVEG